MPPWHASRTPSRYKIARGSDPMVVQAQLDGRLIVLHSNRAKYLTPQKTMQSRILSRPVAVAIRFVVSRPVAFWINATMIAVWLYLLWPLFKPVYLNPIYVIYLTTLT